MRRFLAVFAVLLCLVFLGRTPADGALFGSSWASETFYAGTAVVHTNAASTFTEFNSTQLREDQIWLAPFTQAQCSIGGNAAGATGSVGVLQYSTDGGTNYSDVVTAPIDALSNSTPSVGNWTDIPAAARTLVRVRFGIRGGDAVADPSIGSFRCSFRKL